jgi:hypothetical protein
MRWLEYVEEDLREMKVKIWRQKAVDREEWAFVVKEAKAVRGPYSQGFSTYVSFRLTHNIPAPASPS